MRIKISKKLKIWRGKRKNIWNLYKNSHISYINIIFIWNY